MVQQSERFSSVGEAFYECGVSESGLSGELSVEDVSGWFCEYEGVGDGFVYWIHKPFLFAEVSWVSDEEIEYSVVEPSFSAVEERLLEDIRSEDMRLLGLLLR